VHRRKIDVLVNDLHTEAGILDQGSQIVVIWEDLAKEVIAKINTRRTLRMEGANGSTTIFQATEGGTSITRDVLTFPPATDRARAHDDESPAVIDRATTRKLTCHSPFDMTHSTEPMLPFDIPLATFLIPNRADELPTADLIANRAWQLQRREDNLAATHSNILKGCFEPVRQFERRLKDGTISNLYFAACSLFPYHAQSCSPIPMTRLVDRDDLARVDTDEDSTEPTPTMFDRCTVIAPEPIRHAFSLSLRRC
jgi:hypothetical protein